MDVLYVCYTFEATCYECGMTEEVSIDLDFEYEPDARNEASERLQLDGWAVDPLVCPDCLTGD